VAIALRVHELRDVPDRRPVDPASVERLRADEDRVAHNPFAVVGFLKPGTFRAVLTRVVLFAISYAVRHVLNRGSLAGVKTIHFARWVYLTPELMTFFSNGVGYPPTVLLFWRGASDEELFKKNLRNRQVPNHVWYSAYHDLTALNVASNAAVRRGLARRTLSDDEASDWLALL
jgi:hypothetical protein